MPESLMLEDGEENGRPIARISGMIAPGDGARMAAQLATLEPVPEIVFLHSPGGSVSDALTLGRAIREAGLDTEIAEGDVCLSACPYLLAAGAHRRAAEASWVGVHQHYFGENTVLPAFLAVEDVQRGQGEVMAYLDDMGIDLRVMRHALVTPPDEIYILLPEELETYDLAEVVPLDS